MTAVKVTPESRLLHDLQIDGDDASELMQEYQQRFSVDLANFHLSDYFGSEGWWRFLPSIVGKNPGDYLTKKPLTILLLAQAATAGRWPP